jgi:hypothetical protein
MPVHRLTAAQACYDEAAPRANHLCVRSPRPALGSIESAPLAPATLPVIVWIHDACWVFEVIPEPRRLTAGPVARLPPELVIAGVTDGLSEAATVIATALRAAGMTASAVRLHGVIDDFVALNATSALRRTAS